MQPMHSARRKGSIRALRRALSHMDGHYRQGATPTVRHLLVPLGPQGAALGAALLALPFLSPMSLGPLTLPASALIVLLGWQLLGHREGAPLPDRLLNLGVPQAVHRIMGAVLRRVAFWARRLSRPRFGRWVEGRSGRVLCGVGMIFGALLLAVPVPLLPLTNTLPALAILCFALGWSEQDGLLTVAGSASLLLSVLYFAGIGIAVALVGWEAVRALVPWMGG